MARPRKEPHIFKVGDVYQAYFSRSDRRSLFTKDFQEAQVRFTALLQNGGFQEIPSNGKSIAEIIKITHQRSKVGQSPKQAYELGLNLARVGDFLESLQLYSPNEIFKDHVEQYKAFRTTGEKPVGPARVNREMTNWLKMMRVAKELAAYTRAAKLEEMFDFFKEPKPAPSKLIIPDTTEFESFFQALDDRYVALVRFVLGSGIRDDEARHFEAINLIKIDDTHYQLTITPLPPGKCSCHPKGWNTKNYQHRDIPISKDTYDWGHKYLLTRNQYNLHKKTSQRKVWEEIDLACEIAGIDHLSMHIFRHSYASYLFKAGFDISTISKWLGHADIETTKRYIHPIGKQLPSTAQLPF